MVKSMLKSPQIELSSVDCPTLDRLEELPLPYIELEAKGIIVRVNRAALNLHPSERGELIGRMAWELLAPEEMNSSHAAFTAIMESAEEPPTVLRALNTRSGEFRNFALYRNPIRDRENKPTGMRILCVDMTDALKELENAQHAELWVKSILDSLTDAVIVTDALGFIRDINTAAEELFNWTVSKIVGTSLDQELLLHWLDTNGQHTRATLPYVWTVRKKESPLR